MHKKKYLEPVCIVYEPTYSEDEDAAVLCFLIDQIHLAYRSHVGKIINGKEKVTQPSSRQCPFRENFLAKSTENMSKHVKICTAKEGIAYTFDNGDIISFQDNFKFMGGVSFTVYFNFKTTTSNSVFFDPKEKTCCCRK